MSLLDKASLIVTPNAYKESKLYSVVPNTTLGDMDVVRATTATRVNSSGLIEVVPRNLFQYSEAISTSPWALVRATVSTNSINSPTGTLTADTLVSNITGSDGSWTRQIVSAINGNFNMSIYAKQGTSPFLQVRLDGLGAVIFNLSNGTVKLSSSGIIGSITSIGSDGWYRCSISGAATGQTTALFIVGNSSMNLTTWFATNGDSVYLWGAQLEQGSTATEYFPTTTRLNIPRIDYTNGSCPSLLVEPQRTNVTTESETITASTGTTVTLNNTISPDGTQNADKLVEDTSTGVHITVLGGSLGGSVDSSVYSVSVFAKADGRSRIRIFDNNQSTAGSTDFNISSGVVISGAGKIENYGNGWYRCIIFPAKTNSTNSNCQIRLLDNSGNVSYTGNGTSGVFLWGKQIEQGAYATSYVRTLASSVTRNADVISKTGISSLIGQTEGTVFVNWKQNALSNTNGIYANNYNLTGSISIQVNTSGKLQAFVLNNGSFFDLSTPNNTIQVGQSYKVAFAYKSGSLALYLNGNQIQTATTNFSFTTTLSEIDLSNKIIYFAQICETSVKTTAIWKERLSNSELAQLTTL
jgi:hypothetical protein